MRPNWGSLMGLSERGHFMVLPRSVGGNKHVHKSSTPAHHFSLRCLPYQAVTLEVVSAELVADAPMLNSVSIMRTA